jgi:hypothetical protein
MVLRMRTGVLTAVLLLAVFGERPAAQPQRVDVTGAWDLTITKPDGPVSGLAILSQDDAKVTGMMGPAVTDMFPVEGSWEGNKLIILARPRKGRTTAFAKCEATGTREQMTGTIDTDKGTIKFIRKQRQN